MHTFILVLASLVFGVHGLRAQVQHDSTQNHGQNLKQGEDLMQRSFANSAAKQTQSDGEDPNTKALATLLSALDQLAEYFANRAGRGIVSTSESSNQDAQTEHVNGGKNHHWLQSSGSEAASPATAPARSNACEHQQEIEQAARGIRKLLEGVLARTGKLLEKAVKQDWNGEVIAADRDALIQSFEAFTAVLDKLGGIGNFISSNTKKMKNAKGEASKTDYREWVLSELHVHAAKNYQDYADPSAGVASIWIGWTLEFFVELFANLHKGLETLPSIDDAYKNTLMSHHNVFMRKAFMMGVKQKMQDVVQDLKGDRDVEEFVKIGRHVVAYLKQLHEDVYKRMRAERQASNSQSSGALSSISK